MADRAPRRSSLPMSGARLTAALECANDAGVRFTLRRPGDSHGASRLSAGAAASCASADRPASAVGAAPSVDGSDPPVRGPGTGSDAGVFSHPCPRPFGVAPDPINPYAGRRFERRFEAAEHQFAGPLSVGLSDIAAPATVVQPQSSQRHTEPLARTSQRWFRAHAPRCRCARAVRHRPPVIGGQDRPPEPLSTRLQNNLPIIAPDS